MKPTMNVSEFFRAMLAGKRCHHESWQPHEWIQLREDDLYDERGEAVWIDEFDGMGYSIFEPVEAN
jgi:hypothetical protein